MAIAKMSHLRLVGLRSQENTILDTLTDGGAFEVRETDAVRAELERGSGGAENELKLKQAKISFALGFLKARHAAMAAILSRKDGAYEYELSKEKFSDARMLITHADFSDARAKEYDLLGVCDELQKISFDIVDAQSKTAELKNIYREYEPYAEFPLRLSKQGTFGEITVSLYYNRMPVDPSGMLDGENIAYDVRSRNGTLLTLVSRGDITRTERDLSAAGFIKCPFTDDCTARDKLDAIDAEHRDVERFIFELTKKALYYEKHLKDLRILYDVIGLEIERAAADEKFLKTNSAFVLEGWIPEDMADGTVAALREKCPNIFIQLLAPEEKDAPPTLVRNNKVVQPYESITDLYSPPKYRELDPNPVMSVFYFIFFGIMIGDAAYGVILAVLGLVFGCSKKFDSGTKKLLLLVGMGGISAIIWGVLFGGYFAIDFGETDVALWFNPLDDPMTMLILSLALGCVQLVAGYIMQFVKLCIAGKPFDAVCDAGSIILIFAALGCFATSFVLPEAPKGLTVAAIVLAAAGLGLIVIFGGRKNKNIFGKIFGGLSGLYGLVNLLSDILSYCRLFGLCLASCAIGIAFNTLGSVLFGIPGIGYVLGVILLIPMHALNIALGVLSAYVHDARLQFLEFYGKFYEGGGRLFCPLGSRTKYVRYE